jgi:hypothetical protein
LGVGVVGAEDGFSCAECAPVQRLGLVVAALLRVKQGQIVHRNERIWMFATQNALARRKCPLVKLLRLSIPALFVIELGQITLYREGPWILSARK